LLASAFWASLFAGVFILVGIPLLAQLLAFLFGLDTPQPHSFRDVITHPDSPLHALQGTLLGNGVFVETLLSSVLWFLCLLGGLWYFLTPERVWLGQQFRSNAMKLCELQDKYDSKTHQIAKIHGESDLIKARQGQIAIEMKSASDYMQLLGKQMGAALQDSESSILAVVSCLNNVHEVSRNQVTRIVESMNNYIKLTEAVEAQSTHNNQVIKVMKVLAEQMELSPLVDLIKEIAKQTNVIAINAAIEATRAGTAGRTFAVVATEIQRLSRQTTQAAFNISETIEKATRQAAVELGTKETGARLNIENLITSLNAVEGRFSENMAILLDLTAAVKLGNEKALKEFSAAMGHIQFQDVLRQRVQHVQSSMSDLDEHFLKLSKCLNSPNLLEAITPTIRGRMEDDWAGYFSDTQRHVHAQFTGSRVQDTPAQPNIELF
jgi:methyl-accepting chemotaxis protein